MKYNLLGAVSTIALGAAFGVVAPGSANAFLLTGTSLNCTSLTNGTCTETITITASQENFGGGGASGTINLDKWYAPQAGDVLTGVKYQIDGTISNHGTLTNAGAQTSNGRQNASMTLTMSPGGGAPSNFMVPTLKLTNTGHSSFTTLAPGASAPFAFSKQLGPSGLVNVSSFLSQYTQPGNTGATFAAMALSTSHGGPTSSPLTFVATGTIAETAQVTIDYTYALPPPPPAPTPEPASLALLGAGLAGLGAVRRRRKS
jgi:hypothetical protein